MTATATNTAALHSPPLPQQLSLIAANATPGTCKAQGDDLAWQLGADHAAHGLALPAGHLHPSSPLFAGWQATLARQPKGLHSDPAPEVRQWLRLRMQAWQQGLPFDELLISPNYLRQIDATHCPITRAELHDEQGHPAQRCFVALKPSNGYCAGELVVMGWEAAQALNHHTHASLHPLAEQAKQQGLAMGWTAACWHRLLSLSAMAQSLPTQGQPLTLLPPNRLRVAQPLHALQAWLTRQLTTSGWSQRLQALHDALPGVPARQAATALNAALAPHALRLPPPGMAQRWALEDLWLDARVQRRWQELAALLSPLTVERLLRQLPPPPGWQLETHMPLRHAA
jgi:hypothetical protein